MDKGVKEAGSSPTIQEDEVLEYDEKPIVTTTEHTLSSYGSHPVNIASLSARLPIPLDIGTEEKDDIEVPAVTSVDTKETGNTVGTSISPVSRASFDAGATTGGGAATPTAPGEPDLAERIKDLHEEAVAGVKWDFGYSFMLFTAAVVAGLGLATNSGSTIASSMLLSPIMGPDLAIAFGTVSCDFRLVRRALWHKVLSCIACVFLGVAIGYSCSWFEIAQDWPNEEMLLRGTRTNFLAGLPISFLSGAAVAVDLFDKSLSRLVGVAMSASLLPPAVNCGMCLIAALAKNQHAGSALGSESFQSWLEASSTDYLEVGVISLAITVANSILLAAGACLMGFFRYRWRRAGA